MLRLEIPGDPGVAIVIIALALTFFSVYGALFIVRLHGTSSTETDTQSIRRDRDADSH